MKYLFSIFFILGLLISGINFGFSEDFQCCYDGSTVAPNAYGNCDESEGDIILTGVSSPTACKAIKNNRLKCIKNGVKQCNPGGKIIFENDIIKNFFLTNNICDDFEDYNVGVCDNSYPNIPNIDINTTTNDKTKTKTNNNPLINKYSDEEIDQFNVECRNGGGFLGLFVNKNSCEAVVLAEGNKCVFNPYLGGNINSYFIDSESIGVVSFEKESCIADIALDSCSDLKIQSLCEGSQIKNLAGDCRWVNSTEFESSFSALGMCVSEEISDTKYFNKQIYYFSNNVIKNPSFELSTTDWDLTSGSFSSNSDFNLAYFGNRFVKLSDGGILSQDLENLDINNTYKLNFKMRSLNFTLGGMLSVYYGGRQIGNSYNLESLYEDSYGSYKEKSISFISKSSSGKIEFKFVGTGSIHLDVISLRLPDGKEIKLTNDKIFSPVDIVPLSASYCSTCFSDNGFNFCTQEKSDLLGACSYMVAAPNSSYGEEVDLNNYTGRDNSYGNLLMLEKSWESQSLSNSQLFCEMYVTEDKCVDSSNFVNSKFSSYHLSSDTNLCKWSENSGIGCYKDSNGDDKFDTINNYVIGSSLELENDKYETNTIEHYAYDLSEDSSLKEGLKVSDFQLACDVLPPSTYVALRGKNNNSETVFVGLNDGGRIIGDVYIDVVAEDLNLDSCEPYTFNKFLYVEYSLDNGKSIKFEEASNQYNVESIKLDDFLVDLDGSSLLDGASKLNVTFIDQSGNVGKIWEFDLNIDNSAPIIELVSPDSNISNGDYDLLSPVVGLNFSLDFIITDLGSMVSSCNYNLISYGDVDTSFYTPYGEVEIESSQTVELNFTLPIYNSSSNGDDYLLTLECSDIFNQSSVSNVFFFIDTDTSIVLLTPSSFSSKIGFSGFLNNKSQVILVSTDSGLDSCVLDGFSNLDSTLIDLNVSDYVEEIHGDLLSEFDSISLLDIKKVVIGEIGFSVDGVYTGNYLCTDVLGNTYFEEHTYYYDTVEPSLENFSLIEDNSTMYVDSNGDIYLLVSNESFDYNIEVNLTVEGTGSWIHSYLSKLNSNNFDTTFGMIDNAFFGDAILLNDSFVSSMILSLNVDKQFTSPGIPMNGETGLRNVSFKVDLFDKAGNFGDGFFNYYVDSLNPELNFSGDIYDLDKTDGLIFSRVLNPNFVISFTAPSYRQFSCSVSVERNGQRGLVSEFALSNSFEFKLSDLDINSWFENHKEITMNINCVDVYDIVMYESFTLIYDNTPLLLNEFGLSGGEQIYSRINSDYSPLKDGIYFKFNNTGERGGYVCEYKFEQINSFYNCPFNFSSLNKFESFDYASPIKNILSGYGFSHASDTASYSCDRTSSFTSSERSHFIADTNLDTSFKLIANCFDGAGFEISSSKIINYTYLAQGLISFDYEYVNRDTVRFIVKSLVDYSSIVISTDGFGSDALTNMNSGNQLSDGTFQYVSLDYSIENLAEGKFNLFAVAFDNSIVDGYIATEFFIDKTKPFGGLIVIDLNENGEVYDKTFKLDIEVFDELSGLEFVDLYVTVDGNETLLATFNEFNYTLYTSEFGVELAEFSNTNFYDDVEGGTYLRTSLIFGEAILNSVYTFNLVVTDKVGRQFVDEDVVKYADGIYLILLDSENAFVYNSGYGWLTKSTAPVLNFDTSKVVSCNVNSLDGDYSFELESGTTFSVDLSTLDGFDLNALGDEIDFEIECTREQGTYTFTKTLFFNEKLLDYVLVPGNGFLVNEIPYTTFANIKSVGPFSRISCDYSYLGNTYSVQVNDLGKEINLDFTTAISGTHYLTLDCTDSVGNFGPSKTYEFVVDVNSDLVLDESSLVLTSSDNYESRLDSSNDLFIHSTSSVDLSFNLNKKSVVSCEYGINPVGGVLSGVVNFFRNLFGVERFAVYATTPYEYKVYGLTFEGVESELVIVCEDETGSSISKSYDVYFDNSDLAVSVEMGVE